MNLRGLLFITTLLLHSTTWAFWNADVEFDFYKGYINILPPKYGQNSQYDVLLKRSHCCGFYFFNSQPTITQQGLYSDSYFELKGDPDDLSFLLVQFACAPGSTKAHIALTTYWKFVEPKGRIEVRSHFSSSLEIVDKLLETYDPTNKDRICTDEYRKERASHNLTTLTPVRGYLKHFVDNRGMIRITWDAANWKDPQLREAEEVLKDAKKIFENSNN